jgi:diphthamide synthase subunit DPH2
MNKIEIQKIFSDLSTEINKKDFNNSYSNNITNLTSNVNTMSNYNYNNKFDELKNVLEERYLKYEERIKNSVNINDFEKILIESKELYETIIENIFQVFYNNKTDLNQNKILTIQMPLEKYHQIINNTNTNLAHVDQGINKKISEFKNQGKKIENALKIIMKYVNNKS